MVFFASAAQSAGTNVGAAVHPTRAEYSRIAGEVEHVLREHVLDCWSRRLEKTGDTGLSENFSFDWKPGADEGRSLVYQSRLAWLFSRAAERVGSERTTYLSISRVGLRFLEDSMWDRAAGGFRWSVGPNLTNGGDKHVYGTAFAIYAASRNYRVTHDPAALDLAKRGFAWLEAKCHDSVNGGYFEAVTSDGTPIIGLSTQPIARRFVRRSGADEIGTSFGLKSMNSHIHLLEALTELDSVWPDRKVRERLREVFRIVTAKVIDRRGFQRMFFQSDWRPVPGPDSYGHDIESAYLILEAATELGAGKDPKIWDLARHIVDHTIAVGEDKRFGGIYDSGSADSGPSDPDGQAKIWWVQAEALNATLLMHEHFGHDTNRYWDAFLREWDFITSHQLDRLRMGWYGYLGRNGVSRAGEPKSSSWTEAYHQGRALINVSERLERLAGSRSKEGK